MGTVIERSDRAFVALRKQGRVTGSKTLCGARHQLAVGRATRAFGDLPEVPAPAREPSLIGARPGGAAPCGAWVNVT